MKRNNRRAFIKRSITATWCVLVYNNTGSAMHLAQEAKVGEHEVISLPLRKEN